MCQSINILSSFCIIIIPVSCPAVSHNLQSVQNSTALFSKPQHNHVNFVFSTWLLWLAYLTFGHHYQVTTRGSSSEYLKCHLGMQPIKMGCRKDVCHSDECGQSLHMTNTFLQLCNQTQTYHLTDTDSTKLIDFQRELLAFISKRMDNKAERWAHAYFTDEHSVEHLRVLVLDHVTPTECGRETFESHIL